MSTNAMIDIATGLILMYLVLSLICTVLNEVIATFANLRARTLRAGITKLVDNAALLNIFNDHGLINSAQATIKGKGPSYLSGHTFAAALLDSFDPEKPLVGYQEVADAIKKLPTSNIKDTLTAATINAGGDIEKLRANVATWFDSAMDRVSGAYKRRLQLISFLVGFAVASLLNADSFTVAKALWADGPLRSQVADISYQMVGGSEADEEKLKALSGSLAKLRDDLRPLPIGWIDSPARPDHGWSSGWQGWLAKILGWLFTSAAIMLSAPFWFDLLGKFVKLRASGNKPQQSS